MNNFERLLSLLSTSQLRHICDEKFLEYKQSNRKSYMKSILEELDFEGFASDLPCFPEICATLEQKLGINIFEFLLNSGDEWSLLLSWVQQSNTVQQHTDASHQHSDKLPEQIHSKPTKGDKFFIGLAIDDYITSSILNKCKSDSHKIGRVLQNKFGYQSIYLEDTDVTPRNIQNTLTSLKSQMKPKSKVIICFSGHGEKDSWTIFNNKKTSEKSFKVSSINKMIETIGAHHLLLISDSCHALGVANSKDGVKTHKGTAKQKNLSIWEVLEQDPCCTFLAATGNTEAWDGVFAKYFVKALEKTNSPIDIEEVVSQVRRAMHTDPDIEKGNYQIPQLRQLKPNLQGVFVFSPL